MSKEMYEELFKDVVICGRYPLEKLDEMKWYITSLTDKITMLEKENKELKEEINKISKKELKVRDMLYSIEYGTLTRERLNQIEEVLFELGGDVDDE